MLRLPVALTCIALAVGGVGCGGGDTAGIDTGEAAAPVTEENQASGSNAAGDQDPANAIGGDPVSTPGAQGSSSSAQGTGTAVATEVPTEVPEATPTAAPTEVATEVPT